MAESKKKIGDILLSSGRITKEQLEQALKKQAETHKRLGEVMVSLGIVTENEFIDNLAEQLGVERIFLDEIYINPEVAQSIPREVAKRHNLIPVCERDGKLIVAMSDPAQHLRDRRRAFHHAEAG